MEWMFIFLIPLDDTVKLFFGRKKGERMCVFDFN
jgi:hypothetical protein